MVVIILENSETNSLNLDDVFCGIDPEEVSLLRRENEKHLREVNIVPIAPSIPSLTGLRTFKVIFNQPHQFLMGPDDPTFLFSNVTNLIGFKRCSALTITLELGNQWFERDLSHQEPYVAAVSDDTLGLQYFHG